MQKIKLIFMVFGILILAGCAQKVWVKPGSGQNEFSEARYECLQQSQHQVSRAYVDAYGGAARSGQATNETLFSSCMNAKGWYLNDAEASRIQQQTIKEEIEPLAKV